MHFLGHWFYPLAKLLFQYLWLFMLKVPRWPFCKRQKGPKINLKNDQNRQKFWIRNKSTINFDRGVLELTCPRRCAPCCEFLDSNILHFSSVISLVSLQALLSFSVCDWAQNISDFTFWSDQRWKLKGFFFTLWPRKSRTSSRMPLAPPYFQRSSRFWRWRTQYRQTENIKRLGCVNKVFRSCFAIFL